MDKKTKEEEPKKLSFEGLKRTLKLFKFLKPYKGMYLIGMVMLVFSTLTTLTFPVMIGEMTKVLEGKSIYSLNVSTLSDEPK
mgnify:CR=1 FL=1